MVRVSWVESMNDVGGRLVPAALKFLEAEHAGAPAAGPAGVRWLAERVERCSEREPDDARDAIFVEGAGALLGLLLVEHLGGCTKERDGAHRVQLGRFGWFDPFEAITEALEAEHPRGCLARSLALAEREARQDGPISRVVSLFDDVLSEERPDVEIVSQFEWTVELSNGAVVDLARLQAAADDLDEETAAEAARRLVSMIPGKAEPRETTWAEAAARIFPRLVSRSFLASLPNPEALYHDEVGHDVHLALQLRYGSRARFVRRAEVERWGGDEVAFHQAIRNLASHSRELRLEPVDDGLLRVRQGDGLDAARLVLPDLAVRLRQLSADPWLAAAPHRDVLLVGPSDSAPVLAQLAGDANGRAPHPISSALFSVTEDGLFPVRP